MEVLLIRVSKKITQTIGHKRVLEAIDPTARNTVRANVTE